MNLNDARFSQSILYQGLNITCKSSFGYHYRLKRSLGSTFNSIEFIKEFIAQLNKYVKKQTSRVLAVDIVGFLFEIPMVVVLLVFSAATKDNQTLLVILSVVIILSSLIFIYLKISGIQLLNQRIQEFLDQKKSLLDQRGLRAIVIKARCNDRAPEVFINLLPENILPGTDISHKDDSQPLANMESFQYQRISSQKPLKAEDYRHIQPNDVSVELKISH